MPSLTAFSRGVYSAAGEKVISESFKVKVLLFPTLECLGKGINFGKPWKSSVILEDSWKFHTQNFLYRKRFRSLEPSFPGTFVLNKQLN